MFNNVHVLDDPLAQCCLLRLRDRKTAGGGKQTPFFRCALGLSHLLMQAAIGKKLMQVHEVVTPLKVSVWGITIRHEECYFVYVRRAGRVFLDAVRQMLPIDRKACGVIDIHRDEKTAEPLVGRRHRLADDLAGKTVFLLDPMIATGGSANAAIRLLQDRGAKKIILVGWIAAPEGLRKIESAHPDVTIYVAAIDEKLNDVFYIVPGLGDAGDRLYGTDKDENGKRLVRSVVTVGS